MQKLLYSLTNGAICLALVLVSGASFGDSRTAPATRGRGTISSARMPSIPVLPVSATGNMTVPSSEINPTPNPNPNPNPNPDPNPNPNPEPDTPVDPGCPDGGVANSSYTVENCMNDVLGCVNGGALPNGINSLFNEDLRNSIVNGMGLCLTQVEHCVSTVRRNCQNVYASTSDVWLDFNARKVQPEYYRFVLAQTGLTPTQAENTCLLLDRNTYGAAFNAVSTSNNVTSEYAQQVGAYNSQMNNSLSKANPLGAQVNRTGIDGNRGYYARWDAENAQCLLRVAAYNKDTPIKNSWLFGAIGDESPAEVWQATGSTFTCNKDLFGFSLMNKTKTAAVVGIGGGTLLGAGIGAAVGHGDRKFDCSNASMRDNLLKKIQDGQKVGYLNKYLDTQMTSTDKTMSLGLCNEIIELYDLWQMGKGAISDCESKTNILVELKADFSIEKLQQQCDNLCMTEDQFNKLIAAMQAPLKEFLEQQSARVKDAMEYCTFVELNKARRDGTGVYCKGTGNNCIPKAEFEAELAELGRIFNSLDILEGEKSNRLKTTLAGAGIGAAAGGTATAITAFVERNNINCRVADGLAKVAFGKSYTIDRLRDFYVKWALNLPSTLAPTAVVTNCDNWQLTCALFTDLDECRAAQFNYRPGNLSSTTLIQNACTPSGSACIANLGVAQSNGECLMTPVVPDTPIPSVSDCNEWVDACKPITNATECNSAKVIYTPQSMQVSNACKYQTAINECRPSLQKARQYLDVNTCPIRLE